MRIWQADFYRRPLQDEAGVVELLICDATRLLSMRRCVRSRKRIVAGSFSKSIGSGSKLARFNSSVSSAVVEFNSVS